MDTGLPIPNIPRTSGTSGGEARSLMRTWWETSVRMGISMATLTPQNPKHGTLENHLRERERFHLPNLHDFGFHGKIFRGVFGSKILGGGLHPIHLRSLLLGGLGSGLDERDGYLGMPNPKPPIC